MSNYPHKEIQYLAGRSHLAVEAQGPTPCPGWKNNRTSLGLHSVTSRGLLMSAPKMVGGERRTPTRRTSTALPHCTGSHSRQCFAPMAGITEPIISRSRSAFLPTSTHSQDHLKSTMHPDWARFYSCRTRAAHFQSGTPVPSSSPPARRHCLAFVVLFGQPLDVGNEGLGTLGSW